ncbi:hypothetical protein BJV77DRAFT_1061506 [Russula vinacea]|nr:hypothetical protein BJV77DRAFT_1061506 [Russula vinacea]
MLPLPRTGTQGSARPFHHRFWRGLLGRDRRWISWRKSAYAIIFSSWLNALLVFIPLAWVSHFQEWAHGLTFALCFLSIVALEKIFDWGGEQLAMYCGPDLGDLIVITLNNIVEATLAIILLLRCEYVSLSIRSIIGVVLLHLLLIPGTAFLTGGARVWEQQLHPHPQTESSVLALTIPSAFFAAVDTQSTNNPEPTGLSDFIRRDLLRISRGFAVILLAMYAPFRPDDDSMPHPEIPLEALRKERELAEAEPDVNPWACIALLVFTVGLMGVTAEFLVDSIESVQSASNIQEEWFGIILLPIVSFSADGAVAIVFFIRSSLRQFFTAPEKPDLLAEARAIDMSIQFLLFWMPLVTLLGWWLNKPMSMFFDLFEVVLLVGACFLVNYVTADAKTNWAEGWVLVSFYLMIGLSAWYYPGQGENRTMNACESIVEAIANSVGQDQ